MAKKGGGPNAPVNNLANNGVYVLMDEITMQSCADCLKWIMNQNLAETRLPQLTIIINSPGFYLHIQDAVVIIQYCIDGILNIASKFKI